VSNSITRDFQRLTHRVKMKPSSGYSPLTLVPSYPDLPMEEVYARVKKTDIPGVYVREMGRGRVIYFPWDVDRTFWEVLDVNHARLLKNAVLWATNEEAPLEVSGAGVLDISIWTQKSSMAVHLVNLTNPMMMKGPMRDLIPIGPQKVRVRLPDGARPRRVKLLAANVIPRVEHTGRYLTVTVPSILDHEVVAVDL